MALTEIADRPAGEDAPSLHQRILSDISEKIVSGEWAPGHRIPFEYELSATYNCSRMTVNKALSQLAKAGMIERRRRSGSFVRRPKSQAAILEIHDIKTEVQALGLPYRYQLVSRRMRRGTADDRERLGLTEPSTVIALTSLHFAGHRPFCHEDRLISLRTVPDAEHEAFAEIAPGPWLVGRIPWSVAEHRIRAAGVDAGVASTLDIDAGTPSLVVERQTWSADQPVTHVRFTYAGDGHTLVARFTPAQG
ncbi:histidine utilization repressor [Mesorhizobium sp. LHD-90]|uniref:histidine utilization repressor n=1 Tax=Mesorhizobium sp. LHD-90 TaxID=3071414 RepID=UPI0027DEEDDC|nr:histidine utilization repressor [Mesorhizobium sp. LHD-90]MDQ6435016.1 histidine utilization repressor [Mesorhizobium sp. LHD-90]